MLLSAETDSHLILKHFRLSMLYEQDSGFKRKMLLTKIFQMCSGFCDQKLTVKLITPEPGFHLTRELPCT